MRRQSTSEIDVAVLDADQRQSLVCVQSLGHAGVRVGAFDSRPVAAFGSRWCTAHGVLADGAREPESYVRNVLELIERRKPKVLIVSSDETVERLRARRSEFEERARLALAPNTAVDVAVDKTRTLELAESLGIPFPRSASLQGVEDLEGAVQEIGLPAVVKPVRSWIESGDSGQRLGPRVVLGLDELRAAVAPSFAHSAAVLLQQWIPGRREAVWLFYAHGRFWARFAQVAHRMYPALGGSSILRESIPVPRDVGEAAEALVEAAGLEGYSEIEFRRDAAGRPILMEINPRISASLEVAVRAGVDFPGLIYAWGVGRPLRATTNYRVGVRVRWLGGDVRWLRETLSSQGRPDIVPAGKAVRTFVGDFFRRGSYDYVHVDDLRPAVSATIGFATQGMRRGHTSSRNEPRGVEA